MIPTLQMKKRKTRNIKWCRDHHKAGEYLRWSAGASFLVSGAGGEKMDSILNLQFLCHHLLNCCLQLPLSGVTKIATDKEF